MRRARVTKVIGLPAILSVLLGSGVAQQGSGTLPAPGASQTQPAMTQQAPDFSRALDLSQKLRNVTLDAEHIYKVREATLDREDLHIYLTDGTLVFMKSVEGRITGAVFEGEGEILVKPPNRTERSALGLFTGLGILNDHFTSAYLRFNDDTARELETRLIPTDEASDFPARYESVARALAPVDAIRLLATYVSDFSATSRPRDRMLHARINTREHGNYDVYYDSMAEEQIVVGQLSSGASTNYDMWMAFPGRKTRQSPESGPPLGDPWRSTFSVRVDKYTVSTQVFPPTELTAEAKLELNAVEGGQGLLIFELSRYLRIEEITLNGTAVRFLQNESLEGSELSKRGNDTVVVLLPKPLKRGERPELTFKYGGAVMSDAGNGLIYVGPRGTWYPNRGLAMSEYDLTFRCPSEWTLIATGQRVSERREGDFEVGHWVSEKPMPLAGFNLGRYVKRSAKADAGTKIETFAIGKVVESSVKPAAPKIGAEGVALGRGGMQTMVLDQNDATSAPDAVQTVADSSARALDFYSKRFGPYPYSTLSLTQMPSNHSQGWPGLIFLSSMVFTTPAERQKLRMNRYENLLFGELMLSHEVAHQWWGGLVSWRGYRDQWISEALANYSALMMIETRRPEDVKHVLERYRSDLEFKSPTGKPYKDAGPVTLGVRLSSSQFPQGYEIISYERGTWLMHMLRTMFRDGAVLDGKRAKSTDPEEPFARALRNVCQKHAFSEVGIPELQAAFEAELPASLRFEGKKSLDWFFDTWVNNTEIPKLELKDVKITRHGSFARVSGTVLQTDAAEDLVTSVPIYGVVKGKQVLLGRVFADGKESTFQLRAPATVLRVVMDPFRTVLTNTD